MKIILKNYYNSFNWRFIYESKKLFSTMCCPLVLEHIKLILSKTGEEPVTVILKNEDFEKYADKKVKYWGVYPTRIDLKNPSGGISVYGYISIEIEK